MTLLVLDANILIRATLGKKVGLYLTTFSDRVDFFTPDTCIEEAEKYLPILFKKRGMPSQPALEVFSFVKKFLKIVDESIYQERAIEAQQRMKRDIRDWPAVATALLFNCPIWTEDQDFFGVGIPVWTTDRIHLFFDSLPPTA
ncbi:MAG: PIN domain-containing protein [Gammaproteobacteria bacterium]